MGAGSSIPGEPHWDDVEADPTGWPGLELMFCDHCGAASSKLLRCSMCRSAFFCNQQCQRAAWSNHRVICGRRPVADERPASGPGSPASSAPGSPRTPGVAKEALRKGVVAFRERRFREALQSAEEAAAAAMQGSPGESGAELRCEALRLRGQCLEQLADLTQAKETYSESLAEAKARLTGSARAKAEANALLRLGSIAARSSRPGIAVQYQRKAVSLLEADGQEKDVLAAAYNNLGISAMRHGLEDAAKMAFERACALRTETGDVEGLCACSTNLANLLRSRDQPADAAQHLERARTMARDSKNTRLERQVLVNLANLYENELPALESSSSADLESTTAADSQLSVCSQDTAEPSVQPVEVTSAGADDSLASPRSDSQHSGDEVYPADAPKQPGSMVPTEPKPKLGKGIAEEREPQLALTPIQAAERALRCRRALFGLQEAPPSQPEPRCGGCGLDLCEPGCKQLRCTRCRGAVYCSAACQRNAWPEHSQKCRRPSSEEQALRAQICPVCLEGLGLLERTGPGASKIAILECLHCLHMACWEECQASRGGSCPVCRSTLEYSV